MPEEVRVLNRCISVAPDADKTVARRFPARRQSRIHWAIMEEDQVKIGTVA